MKPLKFDDITVQVHLHSPLFYTHYLEVDAVDVIGIETATHPENLELVERDSIESADKGLRIGVARSDIDALIAEYNAKHGVNLWKQPEKFVDAINELENPEVIIKRIELAYEIFGDLIQFVGPDCGLGSWVTQESAIKLLENVRTALDTFRETHDIENH